MVQFLHLMVALLLTYYLLRSYNMYKLKKDFSIGEVSSVTRLLDGASIPLDPANTDYQEYLEWVAEGGIVQVAD